MMQRTSSSFDASDLLSPIIVKELRQGLRGRVFQSAFLLVQVAMILCVSGALVATSAIDGEQLQMFSGFFWLIVSAPLVAVIPLMGLAALRGEIKANSLELVYLTRLTPWRIVAGKWAALSAQSLLFVFSILPYLVLRYFLGGIDLVNELRMLLVLLGVCLLFTSVTVGFSAHPPWMVRVGVALFFLFGLQFAMAAMFAGRVFAMAGSGLGGIDSNPFVIVPVFGTLGLLLMLELGTSKIAPAAATRSLQIRCIGLLTLGAATALHLLGDKSGIALFAAAPLLFVICITSLIETPRWIRSIYAPYAKRGAIARRLGRLFFYPGWQSGVGYTTIVAAAMAFLIIPMASEGGLFAILIIYTSAIFTVAVTRAIRPTTPHGISWFLTIQLSMLLMAIMMSVIHHTHIGQIPAILAFPPTTLGLAVAWEIFPGFNLPLYSTITVVVLLLSLLVLAWRSYLLRPMVRRMETISPAEAPQEA